MKNLGSRVIVCATAVFAFVLFAPSAFAQYYRHQYLEAECPSTSSGAYATAQSSIAGYSGSGYLRSTGNTSVATYNNTSSDHVTYRFTIRDPWYYSVWVRVNTNNSANDDSFFYDATGDQLSWTTVNGMPAASGWRWVGGDPNAFMILGEGTYTLEIANREDGLNIDKIAILPFDAAPPTGAGQPAYNCPVPLYFEAECRDGAFAAYQLDKKAKSGYSGGGYIESNTTTTDSNTRVDESTFFFETGAAAYNFFFRINNNSNASNDSWFYSVDNAAWVTMNNTSGLGSGWRWAQGPSSVTLTRGTHTLRVRNREAGLSIDKLAFVPTSVAGPSGTGAGSAAVNCQPHQTMSDWARHEVLQYYDTHLGYMIQSGEHMMTHHVDWHSLNGPGGTYGAGSGTAFLGFHRAMMNDFRRYALETNSRSWLPIATVGPVFPNYLGDANDSLAALGMSDQYVPRADQSMTDWGVPRYLTAGGVANANWDSNVVVDGVTYNKLEDYNDLDTLGRAIASQYHASLHISVSGTMDSFYSPADPIFFGWHGLIDKLATAWLATAKGQAWAAANPSHPFLVTGFIDMHRWDNEDFAP